MTLGTYTLADVAAHNHSGSAWIVIHDHVYDVTQFLQEHPGGQDVLLELAGKAATESFEEVGHSSDARNLMKQYLKGTLKSA